MSQPFPPHECGGRGKDRYRAEAPSEKSLAGSLLEAGKFEARELECGTMVEAEHWPKLRPFMLADWWPTLKPLMSADWWPGKLRTQLRLRH